MVTNNDKLDNRLKSILSQYTILTSHNQIDNIEFESALRKYAKQKYIIDENFKKFLKVVYNKKIQYPLKKEYGIINFDTKKVLKDYPNMLIKSFERKFNLEGIIPFAEIYNGYMVIVKDNEERVFGIYDHLVLLFGNSLLEGIDNILMDKELKRISE